MFIELFLKECKQILKSLTYLIIVAFIILFYFTQFDSSNTVVKPKEGLESYGTKYSDDKNVIMRESLRGLVYEYSANSYIAYPIGFYKQVILKDEKQVKIKDIIEKITGLPIDKVEKLGRNEIFPDSSISYEQFEELMGKADKIIGGGTNYTEKALYINAEVPMTYEEALEEYNSLLYDDRITNATARLFSDYMGIILAILPVFLAVTRSLRDKRSLADGVIFAKKSSSVNIILSRYLANVVMLLLPLMIIAIFPTLECNYLGDIVGIKADSLAFYKYIFAWLLPTILITTSVGFFITELTNSALAILFQGGWWFVSIFMSVNNLVGNVGMNLVPRFNSEGSYHVFEKIFDELVLNRITYSILGILLILATVFVYEAKRKGKWNEHGKIFRNKQDGILA